jgi:hypothetical protein
MKQLIAAILLLCGLAARGADDGFENPQRARFEAARQRISEAVASNNIEVDNFIAVEIADGTIIICPQDSLYNVYTIQRGNGVRKLSKLKGSLPQITSIFEFASALKAPLICETVKEKKEYNPFYWYFGVFDAENKALLEINDDSTERPITSEHAECVMQLVLEGLGIMPDTTYHLIVSERYDYDMVQVIDNLPSNVKSEAMSELYSDLPKKCRSVKSVRYPQFKKHLLHATTKRAKDGYLWVNTQIAIKTMGNENEINLEYVLDGKSVQTRADARKLMKLRMSQISSLEVDYNPSQGLVKAFISCR